MAYILHHRFIFKCKIALDILMDTLLKTKLEKIVYGSIEHLSKNGALAPKRIVLYFSEGRKRNDSSEILSRVETHFLNHPDRMEKGIKVVNSHLYKRKIPAEKGDCAIDIGFLLRKDEFRNFLLKKAAKNYARGFSAFEEWAEKYQGEHRTCLSRFVECLKKRNSGGASRVLPPLDHLDIDYVLDEISYQLIS